MKTDNLKELRELRNQEKAIKARIDEISTEATNEAVAILAEKGLEKGEFEVEGIGKFQLQRTEVFDFADYHKYVPTGTGGEVARECQGESQRAELSQGAYRRHERIREDVRGVVP